MTTAANETSKQSFISNWTSFPPIIDDNLIETNAFLVAAAGVVEFVDLLGNAFIPVRNDINGNINKLRQIYETDVNKFKYLNAIVKSECDSNEDIGRGTDALIWLKRALYYNYIFLSLFLADFEEGKQTESLYEFFSEAYEKSLKQYHNWFVQQLCALCLMAAPGRQSLINYLATHDQTIAEHVIFAAIKTYVNAMNQNILAVNSLLDECKVIH